MKRLFLFWIPVLLVCLSIFVLSQDRASAQHSDALLARLRKAGDPAKEGVAACAELAAKAKDIQGVRGIHVFSGGREDALAPILEQAGLTRA